MNSSSSCFFWGVFIIGLGRISGYGYTPPLALHGLALSGRNALYVEEQGSGIHRYPLLTSGEPEPLGGRCLNRDRVRLYPQYRSQRLLHPTDMRPQPRSLGQYRTIDISHPIALFGHLLHAPLQQNFTVYPSEFRSVIGKMLSDITQCQGSKQCVTQGVYQYVAVRVSHQSFIMFNTDAANP